MEVYAHGYVLLVNRDFVGQSVEDFFNECIKKEWLITSNVITNEQAEELKTAVAFCNAYQNYFLINELTLPIEQIWQNIDYFSTRLPKLDTLRFTDLEQGMWEFYVPKNAPDEHYQEASSENSVRARNPELDICSGSVAIDFGTSSTVVAIRQDGRDELLRIGMQANDFNRHEIHENDFENPTVLEFLDIQQLLSDWHSESYRPLVDWNTVHCSHEARTRFRNNDTAPDIVGSVFARLKQWALRGADEARVRVIDQKHQYEYEFSPLTEYNPVKGRAIQLGESYPALDPIELYAWFLGMNINWRERGIFLKYYMTFPVAYPNEVKQKILASFRRGLQRSLPDSLLYGERFGEFSVQELASEPAAFAAAALRTLNIEPTEEGVAYAVFDFGGGTTDFDYGIYREPDDEEYDAGFDDVIEHFGSSGDKFLGGENLLENMAYLVFKDNQDECRKKNIAFTKPIDAFNFVGSERLVAQTQSAYTNTTLLMSKLRPLWERGQIDEYDSGKVILALLNREGVEVDCEIIINQEELISYLEERILQGLIGFATAMKSSFDKQQGKMPEVVHVLLGGNSSRSRIVQGFLDLLEDEGSKRLGDLFDKEFNKIFDYNDDLQRWEIHPVMESHFDNLFKPNTKTGVALGLLKIAPGESLKVINHANQANGDSPFQFYVGSHRRDKFVAGIKRGDSYGEWKELGRIRQGIFPLLYTTHAQAEIDESMMRGTSGLREQNLDFSGSDNQGKTVFARIISPNRIEIGLAKGMEQEIQTVCQIDLKL